MVSGLFTSPQFFMKPLRYTASLLFLLAFGRAATAQNVANNGFETWATRNGVEAPTGWLTTDDMYAYYTQLAPGSYNLGAVVKSTDSHSGSYAAKLITTSVPTNSGGSVLVPGTVILGAKAGDYTYFGIPIGGVNYTAKPTQMQVFYKFSGTATDSARAIIYLSTTTNGVPRAIAVGSQYLQPAATYTAATIPIGYDPSFTGAPDSIHIVLTSGYGKNINKGFLTNIKAGSTLLVDDITITGGVLATRADASTQDLLTVAPNPSPSGHFTINSPDKPALAAAPWQVLDAMGRVVAQQPTQAVPSGQRELDLSALSSGIYLLRLDSKDGTIVRQLTVK